MAIAAVLLVGWRAQFKQTSELKRQEAEARAAAVRQAEIQSAIKRQMIMIGMTCEQVSEAWGYPNSGAKQIVSDQGEEERWIYTHTEHAAEGKVNIETKFSLVFSNNLLVKWEQE